MLCANSVFNFHLCSAVPGKPQTVSVEAVSATELDVSWTAPTTPPNSAPVTGYTVYWRAAEGGMESSSANTGPATTAYQITGLTPGTEYTVNVTAHNSVGESDVGTGSTTTTSSGKCLVHVPTTFTETFLLCCS